MKLAQRLGVLAVMVAFGVSAGSIASAGVQSGCGPQVVTQRGALVVLPTGSDDTLNLQCAIDRAGGLGIRRIELVKGTYFTGQIVANSFVGDLVGAGVEKTVIRNLPEPFYVTPVDMYLAAPSVDNPWPSLLAFVDGRFRVSDLTIRIAGAPTQGWSIFGIAPPIQALAHGIVIVGARAEATIESVTIEGGWVIGQAFPFSMSAFVQFEQATLAFGIEPGAALAIYHQNGRKEVPALKPGQGYEWELRYFLDCLAANDSPGRCPPAESRDAIAMAVAARDSIAAGVPVPVG